MPVAPHETLPRSFRRIRMELAREKGRPSGDAGSGYILVVPLDRDGRLDAELWRLHRDACRVNRFRPGQDPDVGHVIHRPGGSWAFHYDVRGDEADEAGFRFQAERFVLGEYVSIHEDDGVHVFKIVSVEHPDA
jgi:hypothetical protein